jgi:hypothetical protein
MATFDQRNQKVGGNQYNIIGDFNFDSIQNKSDASSELQKLLPEIHKAVQNETIKPENAIDIEAIIKKAVIEAQKQDANPTVILDYLDKAKSLIESLTSATGFVSILVKAINMIRRLFFL